VKSNAAYNAFTKKQEVPYVERTLSTVQGLLEPGPVVLVSTARVDWANIM